MTRISWTDEMLDKLADSVKENSELVKENSESIKQLRDESKELGIRFLRLSAGFSVGS